MGNGFVEGKRKKRRELILQRLSIPDWSEKFTNCFWLFQELNQPPERLVQTCELSLKAILANNISVYPKKVNLLITCTIFDVVINRSKSLIISILKK